MDAPAQLTSRSLDRGTSVASPSADSDADAERRDSGGSRGSAGDAASRAALMQQLSELSDINRQLTAAIEDKDVIIAQLQARPPFAPINFQLSLSRQRMPVRLLVACSNHKELLHVLPES